MIKFTIDIEEKDKGGEKILDINSEGLALPRGTHPSRLESHFAKAFALGVDKLQREILEEIGGETTEVTPFTLVTRKRDENQDL